VKLFTAHVTGNDEIMADIHIITLDAGSNARAATPGRFIHIGCGDGTLLRRPMAIYRAEGDAIELMVRKVGVGSGWIARRRPGDALDCLGPLGNGFLLNHNVRNLLMVGGNYGVAPLVGLAELAIARGMNVALAVGASTADAVFPPRLLPEAVEYLVATDDGSTGHMGSVTDLVPERLMWADAMYVYGPIPMMHTLATIMRAQAPNKPTQIGIEERMGCAMGVCLGCVVETTKGPLRTCTEGPVFDMRQIVWRDEPSKARSGQLVGAH
jgi:dihydroorotate dehydrogenase electron transfer subunit